MRHEARQLPSWLIYDVSQKTRLPSSIAVPDFKSCRQQSRSARALSPKPSSWFVASRHHPRGMISCIASTCDRRLRLDLRTFEPDACTRMRRFGKNSRRRDDWLVFGGSAISSLHSAVYRAGFRALCSSHGCSHHRSSGARVAGAQARPLSSRIPRRAIEGSPRVSLPHHLSVFRLRVLGCDGRALQGTTRPEKANKAPEPTPGSVTPRATERVIESKKRNVDRDAARGAPVPGVAHL